MRLGEAAKYAVFASASIGIALAVAGLRIAKAISESIGSAPPTPQQLEEENHDRHALFRHIPSLKHKVAWRELGNNFPTPLHKGETAGIKFWVKREDLASSDTYGGNKVRTLQHQLAVIEAKAENGDKKASSRVVTLGSGGSNQVLASVVFSEMILRHRVKPNVDSEKPGFPRVTALYASEDKADLDNTLNLLSTLSFLAPGPPEFTKGITWGTPMSVVSRLLSTIMLSKGVVIPPGGNAPIGVLGQISGALELAEQIANGEMPDPDCIYLPVGSSCTISGLILGVALARRLNIGSAFSKKNFQICGVIIHHALAAGQRNVGLQTASWAKNVPFTLQHTLHVASAELERLGGPSLLEDALKMVENGEVRLEASPEIVGKYGSHSNLSLEASQQYDKESRIIDPKSGKPQKELWLCGHFASKAFAEMLRSESNSTEDRTVLFWQTKSAIQPRLKNVDEWETFQRDMPVAVKKWADKGQGYSSLRVGRVNTTEADPRKAASAYRDLMVAIDVKGQSKL